MGRFFTDNIYSGASLTAEQFLFYEIKIVADFFMQRKTIDEIIEIIKKDNLFGYPTERQISRLARACYKRLVALDNEQLINEIVNVPTEIAKQINLYAMMRNYDLIREFMINVVGEKFRIQDYSFTRKDVNVFFSRLQEQNDSVAAWSENTIAKLKQVLTKCLVEVEILDKIGSDTLNPIFISEELLNGIKENNDFNALAAFNYFK